MEWMQVIEKFGVTTAVAFVSIFLGSKLVGIVLNHYFQRETIHDQNVKKFTEAVFEISAAFREMRNATEEKNRIMERKLEEARDDSAEHMREMKDEIQEKYDKIMDQLRVNSGRRGATA